jgi:hypothetical protein
VPVSLARNKDLTSAAIRLYVLLATYADNETARCWPGIDLISEQMNVDRRTVFRKVQELVEHGFLNVESGKNEGSTNTYTLLTGAGYDIDVTPGMTLMSQGGVTLVSHELDSLQLNSMNYVQRPRAALDIEELKKATTLIEQAGSFDTEEVESLCNLLADAIDEYRGGVNTKPAVTQIWRRDMRLLLDRGPLGRAKPERIPHGRVEAAILYVFTHLAEPNAQNFCWAANVQSPVGLRKHWDKLLDAGKRREVSSRPTIVPPRSMNTIYLQTTNQKGAS